MTDRQITQRLASGIWIPIRHGFMKLSAAAAKREPLASGTPTSVPSVSKPFEESWAIQGLLLSHRGRDLIASHTSAAFLHGLPRPLGGWGGPTATAAHGSARMTAAGRVRVAPLPDEDAGHVRGIPATSLARTAADCLRILKPSDALAIADAALAQGLSLEELTAVLDRQAGWPGILRAREVASLASGRRESALESWSAWAFYFHGVPQPTWQVNLFDVSGVWCGRVDCWWEEGLAGEADGRAKYRLAAAERSGSDAEKLVDVLQAERKREKGIRRTGAELERWGAADVLNNGKARELASYLCTKLKAISDTPGFTGSAKLARPTRSA